MNLFKCSHPSKFLRVEREATVEVCDKDFEIVTYHFICSKCSESVTIKYARTIGGVKAFMSKSEK